MPQHDLHELLLLLRQPFWRRMLHANTHRHVIGVGLGTTLMLLGSNLATHPIDAIPHFLWDAFAYGIHGVGFIPLSKHAEPLWAVLSGGK